MSNFVLQPETDVKGLIKNIQWLFDEHWFNGSVHDLRHREIKEAEEILRLLNEQLKLILQNREKPDFSSEEKIQFLSYTIPNIILVCAILFVLWHVYVWWDKLPLDPPTTRVRRWVQKTRRRLR